MNNIQGGPKTQLFIEVCIWWHRKAFYISVLHAE